MQKEVAKIFKVSTSTIENRENNRYEPAIKYIPEIIKFIGYIPNNLFTAKNIREQIRVYRHIHGLTQKELAEQINVSPDSIMDWENGETKPKTESSAKRNCLLTHK